MGLRPNQPQRPTVARCRHPGPPVPVEVHDTLDGTPEVVAWLCPVCTEETRPPPPPWPAELTAAGIHRWGGVTAAEAAVNLQRSLYRRR
jgi:hypothetical protein